MTVAHLVFSALLTVTGGQISTRAQTYPQQDERGIGLLPNPNKKPTVEKGEQRSGKPELVLQTAQSNIFAVVFRPDGRLVASIGYGGNTVKLWQVGTW